MSKPDMTVNELQQMLVEGKPVTIIDVRPSAQRSEWKIEGSQYVDAYQSLNQGDTSLMDALEIPGDTTVVTVCAAGRTSQLASDALRQRGINAVSLEGGMKAWNYAWNTAELSAGEMTVLQVRRVAKGCLSYIAGSAGEAVVVDASLDPGIYVELARQREWQIKYVMDTHVHADYISRTIDLARATGAVHLFTEHAEVDYPFTPLADGDVVPFGNAELKAVLTPGHTPESVSYLLNDSLLLTGDTLFTDGVGRPDLKADHQQGMLKAAQLFKTLRKILILNDNGLMILPAHTSDSIAFDGKLIGDQLSNLAQNIGLLKLEKDAFIEETMKRISAAPANYLQIAAVNKSGSYEGINPADLEAGANRCAVA